MVQQLQRRSRTARPALLAAGPLQFCHPGMVVPAILLHGAGWGASDVHGGGGGLLAARLEGVEGVTTLAADSWWLGRRVNGFLCSSLCLAPSGVTCCLIHVTISRCVLYSTLMQCVRRWRNRRLGSRVALLLLCIAGIVTQRRHRPLVVSGQGPCQRAGCATPV